jgi:hypothetical protein
MKKIGIITFHKAHNYGAVLQAFALKTFLEIKGFSVSFIDYDPPFLAKNKLFTFTLKRGIFFSLKLLLLDIFLLLSKLQKRDKFNRFIATYLNSELRVTNEKGFEVTADYLAIIIGSDQVWNVRLANGVNPVYFGMFKRASQGTKLISFAASFADYKISETEKDMIQNALRAFDAISVRENEGKDFLYSCFSIPSKLVMDPVFLLSKQAWLAALPQPKSSDLGKYVLVYSIGHEHSCNKLADKICSRLGVKKICLNAYLDKGVFRNKFQKASPVDFVHLFANAEFVVTSSYHGTAFSLIFNRNFYSIAHNNEKDSRQLTLLGRLGLSDRFIPYNTNFDELEITKVSKEYNLHDSVKESEVFLLNNIGNA